jgi:hypothetical protein
MYGTTHMETFTPVQGRRAPAEVVLAFREIDPTLDLVCVGPRTWLLFSHRPNVEISREAGRKLWAFDLILAAADRGEREWNPEFLIHVSRRREYWRLMGAGARPLSIYKGEPNSRWVHDARMRDWRWRHEFRQAIQEQDDVREGLEDTRRRRDTITEFVHGEGRSIHRHAFRRPVTVDMGRKSRKRRRGQKGNPHVRRIVQ